MVFAIWQIMDNLLRQKRDNIIYSRNISISAEVASAFFMPENPQNGLQKAIGASYTILGSLALFGLGGYWLDRKGGGESNWLIIGLLLGVIVGMYGLAKYILKK